MNYDKDKMHGQMITILKKLTLENYDSYRWDTILFNDIGFSFDVRYRTIIKQLFKKLFTDYFSIIKHTHNDEDKLLFTIKYNRNDHDRYWEKFKHISKIENEISIGYTEGWTRLNKKIQDDILAFKSLFLSLNEINILKSRIWLSIQVFSAKKIIKELEIINAKCKYIFMFYDGGFEGNIVSQFYKQQGATTITLQHGQCLYRDKNHDRINQSEIGRAHV